MCGCFDCIYFHAEADAYGISHISGGGYQIPGIRKPQEHQKRLQQRQRIQAEHGQSYREQKKNCGYDGNNGSQLRAFYEYSRSNEQHVRRGYCQPGAGRQRFQADN